jgi:hypothetical protein
MLLKYKHYASTMIILNLVNFTRILLTVGLIYYFDPKKGDRATDIYNFFFGDKAVKGFKELLLGKVLYGKDVIRKKDVITDTASSIVSDYSRSNKTSDTSSIASSIVSDYSRSNKTSDTSDTSSTIGKVYIKERPLAYTKFYTPLNYS